MITDRPRPAVRPPAPPGLTTATAAERLRSHGANELPEPRRPSLARRVARSLVEPLTALLLVAALVSGLALGEVAEAVAILAIVVLNTVIGVAQEQRAAAALAALGRLAAPTARARRDGRIVTVPARELVPGDVVVLDAGAGVPADLRLVESSQLEVDESTLTGESLPVAKDARSRAATGASGTDRADMAFSGTLVTRGSGAGEVVATGPATHLGEIARHLAAPQPATPLQTDLAGLSAWLGIGSVLVAAAVFGLSLARAEGGPDALSDAFLSAVALAVAAVPEGLATVTTVSLAIGVRRMADRGAIVRRLTAVETLGATSALVVDKTGTLTENRLRVTDVVVGGGPAVPLDARAPGQRALLERAVLCNDAELDPPSGDTVDLALLQAAGPDTVATTREAWRRLAALPFDASRRRMTTLDARRGDAPVLTLKGAPEAVLARCTSVATSEGPAPLDPVGAADVASVADALAAAGGRVLAVAHRHVTAAELPVADAAGLDAAESGLVLDGLVVLRDPLRPEAAQAVADARSAGIHLIMATGDHPGTARAIADAAGLAGPGTPVVTGADLRAGRPAPTVDGAVLARIEPTQKLDLVEQLRAEGHVVGMTGDGVNDGPALRRADIGVALGRSGTEVARQAADLVVTDDDLATIVDAVREGRGIHDNIRKVVHYLVAGNLSEVAVMVIGLAFFAGLGTPLLPLQLLWVNLLTDGLPALALGLGPHDAGLLARPPRGRHDRMLGGRRLVLLAGRGLVLAAAPIAVLAVARWGFDEGWAVARTAMFCTLVATHLLYGLVLGLPARWRRGMARGRGLLALAIGGGLCLQAAALAWAPLRGLLDLTSLTPALLGLVAGAASVPPAIVAWRQRRDAPNDPRR